MLPSMRGIALVRFPVHSPFDGASQERPSSRGNGSEGSHHPGAARLVEVDHELVAFIDLGSCDLGPIEDLKIIAGLEKRENFDPEGGEDDVGVPRAPDCEAKEEGGGGEGNEWPPPGREGFAEKEVDQQDRDGGPATDCPQEGEEGGLRTACEAKFLVGIGNRFWPGGHGIRISGFRVKRSRGVRIKS